MCPRVYASERAGACVLACVHAWVGGWVIIVITAIVITAIVVTTIASTAIVINAIVINTIVTTDIVITDIVATTIVIIAVVIIAIIVVVFNANNITGQEMQWRCRLAGRRKTPFDTCGKRTYSRTCRKLQVAPRTNILKALGGAVVDVRRHGLREKDVLALSNALLVPSSSCLRKQFLLNGFT